MKRTAYGLMPLAAGMLACAPAQAAQPRVFHIPAQPFARALEAFSSQAQVSIALRNTARCAARSKAVHGTMTAEQALSVLLAGSGCTFRMIDAQTAQIIPAPSPRRAPAARSTQDDEVTVSEVVVTATKRTIGLARAPYAISLVDGASLNEAGQNEMADLAGRVAGLTFTNLGPGRNKIFVRGLSDSPLTGRTQATVGLYLDDTRLTYNAPDPDLRLTDIERVELLRGPQGSLYGAGSISGILQIVTRKPDVTQRSGWISAGATATSGGRPGGVIEGAANLPLITDRLALRLVGYRETVGGYVDDLALGLDDVGQTTRQGGRAALRFQFSPTWTLSAGIAAQTIHSDDTHYASGGLGPRQRANFVAEPHRNDFDASYLTLEGDLGWARLKANGSLQRHGLDSAYDATLARSQFAGGGAGPTSYLESFANRASVSEITLTSPIDQRLSWIAGVFMSEYTSTLNSAMTPIAAGADLYREDRRDHIDETALYGEVTWRVTHRLSLTAGGRLFRLGDETASEVSEPVSGVSARFSGQSRDSGFAPKLVASFEASEDLLIYAQAAEGYRAGGFNTSGRVAQTFGASGGVQPFRRFASDELWNYEAGARLTLLEGDLHLRSAVFRSEWRDIQGDQLLPSGLPFTANIGDGHNTGVELEAQYSHGPWRLETNFLFNDPELKIADSGFSIPGDRGLPGVARFQFGALARYETELGASLRGVFSAETSYVGSSQLTFDNVTAPKMGGYWTSRVSATLASDRWKLTGWIDNLANADGDTFAYGNPFSLRVAAQATPQRPRTVGVVISREF